MSEFDELISREGVYVAGRFGPDWRIAEHKIGGLLVELPEAAELIGSFAAAIQMVLNTMAVAMTDVTPVDWRPVNGWGVSIGPHSLAVHGDRFLLAVTDQVGSFDELRQLLKDAKP